MHESFTLRRNYHLKLTIVFPDRSFIYHVKITIMRSITYLSRRVSFGNLFLQSLRKHTHTHTHTVSVVHREIIHSQSRTSHARLIGIHKSFKRRRQLARSLKRANLPSNFSRRISATANARSAVSTSASPSSFSCSLSFFHSSHLSLSLSSFRDR